MLKKIFFNTDLLVQVQSNRIGFIIIIIFFTLKKKWWYSNIKSHTILTLHSKSSPSKWHDKITIICINYLPHMTTGTIKIHTAIILEYWLPRWQHWVLKITNISKETASLFAITNLSSLALYSLKITTGIKYSPVSVYKLYLLLL